MDEGETLEWRGRSGEGSQNAGDDRELLKLLADYISEKQGFYPGRR